MTGVQTCALPISSDENVQSLKGLIGWFHQNSGELIHEYRRLESRVDYLKRQLEVKHQELEFSLREREAAREAELDL